MRARLALMGLALFALCAWDARAADYAPVLTGKSLVFPVDHGSHADFRTEWWYVTGWLTTANGEPLGFQVTFFRTKPDLGGANGPSANPSSFNPNQILIAHCALSDPARGRLWQDQRVRRAGMGLVQADAGDTAVSIDGWSLLRRQGEYVARIKAEDFEFDLTFAATQPVLLNGEAGVSRKGPDPAAASYYYSMPHLRVTGSIARQGTRAQVKGEAWLDHEWSSEYLDGGAVGWDWLGLNLDDGSAVMAFRMRASDGTSHWAGGTLRSAAGSTTVLRPDQVTFREGRRWVSSRTGIAYPVEWLVHIDDREFTLKPLMDDQENDTRLTTGAIYWEGAVVASAAAGVLGRGYLELTGYGNPLKLP